MAAKTLQTAPQRSMACGPAWQTYVGHRLHSAKTCCQLLLLPLARQACRMVYPITMPIDKMLTGVPERHPRCHSHSPFAAASGREDFCNSCPTCYVVHTMEIVRKLHRTAHTRTLDSQDILGFGGGGRCYVCLG